MPDCKYHSICPFFKNEMDNMPGTAGMYRTKYCHGRARECARYKVIEAAGPGQVPQGMFPYHLEQAEAFIRDRRQHSRA